MRVLTIIALLGIACSAWSQSDAELQSEVREAVKECYYEKAKTNSQTQELARQYRQEGSGSENEFYALFAELMITANPQALPFMYETVLPNLRGKSREVRQAWLAMFVVNCIENEDI